MPASSSADSVDFAPVTTRLTVALVGNPNSGKTTLFNALTGLRQKVANYPGVTVEKKTGFFRTQHGEEAGVIDLPGTYSLLPQSPDEEVARDVLLGLIPGTPRPDVVVCVVDASNLERNLYLVSQVLELGLPAVVALNMTDQAAAHGDTIDVPELARRLGVPVVPMQANAREGVAELRVALSGRVRAPEFAALSLPSLVEQAVESLRWELPNALELPPTATRAALVLLLSDDQTERLAEGFGWAHLTPRFRQSRAALLSKVENWQDDAIGARYGRIGEICAGVLKRGEAGEGGVAPSFTDRLDGVLLHPVWGWLVFLGLMALLFTSIFTLASYPMDAIKWGFDKLAALVQGGMPPGDLRSLVSDGIVKGVGSVVVFLPQILILFLFIGLLEDSGYMARAAFLMDRLMAGVGLHGKSFVPLLSSYACAVPGIMATRTIEDPRDRLATILVAPFMSCSARLPVYALMISLLFPAETASAGSKALVLLGMYALGTVTAFVFAWLFKRTILRGKPTPLAMELPPYRRPSWRTVGAGMFDRAKAFLRRAGTVILALSVILWALSYYPRGQDAKPDERLAESYAGRFGKAIEPVLTPLGFNWKLGIGLIGAQAAREVFVSTMAVVYAVGDEDEKAPANPPDATKPGEAKPAADSGIAAGAAVTTAPIAKVDSPKPAEDEDETRMKGVADAMRADRWPDGRPVFTPLVALTVMIYFVYSLQCFSTVATARRETNTWRWPLFMFAYQTGFAWLAAFAFYQVGRMLGY